MDALNPKKITARDIMSADVVTLNVDTPVKEAITTLLEYRISGAPVVNDSGECVGVFSPADALKRRVEIDEGEAPGPGDFFSLDPQQNEESGEVATGYWSKSGYDPAVLGEDTVGQWMRPDAASVRPQTTVEEVSRRMLEKGVHRVIVMEGKTILGIISTMDVVRLMAGLGPRTGPEATPRRR